MKTYALCPFGWELDALEVRFATLDPVVDVFVVAEATVTYAGRPKPLHLRENAERFARWAHKLRYVVVEDLPTSDEVRQEPAVETTACDSDRWEREAAQRDALRYGLYDLAPTDVLMLSDADEIPDPERAWLRGVAMAREGLVARPRLAMHVGRMGWRWQNALPVIARFFTARTLDENFGGSPQEARLAEGAVYGPEDAGGLGWHLSYLGGVEAIRYKIANAAHHELDVPDYTDPAHLRRCLDTGDDLFRRPHRQQQRCPREGLPPYVVANEERFEALL